MLETLEVLRPVLKIEENSPTYGKISLEPLDRGYGMTIGNALRRGYYSRAYRRSSARVQHSSRGTRRCNTSFNELKARSCEV